jgi:hypothetical protein
LPDFSWFNIPNRENIYQKIPLVHKIHTYKKWPKNIHTFSIPRPSKIYSFLDVWYAKIPSANPATQCDQIRPIFANLAIFNLGFFLILRTSNFWALRFHRKSLLLNMDWDMYIPMYLGT